MTQLIDRSSIMRAIDLICEKFENETGGRMDWVEKEFQEMTNQIFQETGIAVSMIKSGPLNGSFVVRSSADVISDYMLKRIFPRFEYSIRLFFHDDSYHTLVCLDRKPSREEKSELVDYIEIQARQKISGYRSLVAIYFSKEPLGEWLGAELPSRKASFGNVVFLDDIRNQN